MPRTGSCHRFPFLFLLCTLHLLSPVLAYFLKNCTIVYSENVSSPVSVDCEKHDLRGVPDDIPGNYNVASLTLAFNLITHVYDGAFAEFTDLNELFMNTNRLTALTAGMFQGLSNLTLLRLDWNYIRSIDPAAFWPLTSLQALNLETNCMHQLADMIPILQLPHLQVLNITIYNLTSFQSKDLPSNMSSELRELRIVSGSINMFSITTAAFPKLQTIDLSHCCNLDWEWDIPDKSFLRNITKVYFSKVFSFWPFSFYTIKRSLRSLESLEYLELTFIDVDKDREILDIACKITTLRTLNLKFNSKLSDKLTNCTQLTNLDLSFNGLANESISIQQMKQLSNLNLANNHLSKVPDDVKHLPMLQILNLNDNWINQLSCSDFQYVTRLTHLHLDHNHITELKWCVFLHLDELKVLTLNDNFIEIFVLAYMPYKVGLQKLEFLELKGNSFKRLLGGDFKSLKSLKQLQVESDKLVWWNNDAFEDLDELETLSLIVNVVDITNPFLTAQDLPLLKSLKNLTIQFNIESEYPLEYITFSKTPQLKTLSLRSNNLPYLNPELFKSIPHLEALDLSNNKLTSLDFLEKANLNRLSWLDLSLNQLTWINVSVLKSLPALTYVDMSNNSFDCSCSNAEFHRWAKKNDHTQVVGAHRYTCGFPLYKKGTSFMDIDFHSCLIDTKAIIYFISSTIAILLTLLTSFTYHFLKLHLLYGYYLTLAFLYDAKKRKGGSPQRYDAFVSYNVHDELWVCREMLPVLEGEQGWRLCLHHRDFMPGKPIMENITDAIYGSRKTICVISRHYLESEWCSREIQMASHRLFDENNDVLVLVFLEDIPVRHLSSYNHMRRLVKRHTYLSWSQVGCRHPALFWQNLGRALATRDTDLHLNM